MAIALTIPELAIAPHSHKGHSLQPIGQIGFRVIRKHVWGIEFASGKIYGKNDFNISSIDWITDIETCLLLAQIQ